MIWWRRCILKSYTGVPSRLSYTVSCVCLQSCCGNVREMNSTNSVLERGWIFCEAPHFPGAACLECWLPSFITAELFFWRWDGKAEGWKNLLNHCISSGATGTNCHCSRNLRLTSLIAVHCCSLFRAKVSTEIGPESCSANGFSGASSTSQSEVLVTYLRAQTEVHAKEFQTCRWGLSWSCAPGAPAASAEGWEALPWCHPSVFSI